MLYDVEITQQDLSALFDLKGAKPAIESWCGDALPAFPAIPLTMETKSGSNLMWLGADHWILRAPLSKENRLIASLRPDEAPEDISVVLISDTMIFFSITGPEATEIMAVATPLDLHVDSFPHNGATGTEAFGLKALVLRTEGGFQLGVDRSFGPMVMDYLLKINTG